MSKWVPNSRENIRRSRKQENRIANIRDGKTQPGSGNQWHSKGDVVTENELWEAKTTTKKSFTLHLNDLLKLEKYATLDDKEAVFTVEFSNQSRNYITITDDYYDELREALDYVQGLHGFNDEISHDFNRTFVSEKHPEEEIQSLKDDPQLRGIFDYLDATEHLED